MRKISLFIGGLFLAASLFSQTDRLTPETLWQLGRIGFEDVSPDGQTAIFGVQTFEVDSNRSRRPIFAVPTGGGPVVQLTATDKSKCGNALFRPDGKKIGFLRGGKLWEMNPDGSDPKQVSSLTMGGFKWSPDGKKILFTQDIKMEPTTVDLNKDLPKTSGKIFNDLDFRHWDSWSDGEYSNVFVADYEDGKLKGLIQNIMNQPFDSPLASFGGMEQINWSPDGRFILYTCKKLTGTAAATSTNSDIFAFELASGKTVNLSDGLPGYDFDPVFSPDGRYLAWTNRATPGYEADRTRLMIFDLATSQREEITDGWNFECNEPAWLPDGNSLVFLSSKESVYHLFQIDRATKKIRQITDGIFNIESFKVVDNQTVIAQKVSMSHPAEIVRVNLQTGAIRELTDINKDIWGKLKTGRVEKRWVKTTDGKQMLVWLILPPDFDSRKKYPSILFCQGGPQSPLAQSFSYRWNFQLMAANGYVVIAPVRRGCPGMGQEWTDEITGDWGGLAMQDLLSATDEISKEPFIDKEKIGAAGASFGGYSVYWLAGNHQKRFKSFISHCGIFNMESWYGMTEEMFFANHDLGGAYWAGKPGETWAKDSPHKYVQNWDTPMLVIHNELDFRVPISEGFQAFQAARLRGIPAQMLRFDDEGHHVQKPQNSLLWQRTFFDWMDTHLKGTPKPKP